MRGPEKSTWKRGALAPSPRSLRPAAVQCPCCLPGPTDDIRALTAPCSLSLSFSLSFSLSLSLSLSPSLSLSSLPPSLLIPPYAVQMMSDLLCLVERRFGPSKFLTSFLSAVRGGKRKLDVMEAEGGARRQGSLPVTREEREEDGCRDEWMDRARERREREGSERLRKGGEGDGVRFVEGN
jgi:hypothetical protein